MSFSRLTNEELQIRILRVSIQRYKEILAYNTNIDEEYYLKLLKEEEEKLEQMEKEFPEYFL